MFAASRRPISRDRDLPSKKLSRTSNKGEEDSCEESGGAPTPVESKAKGQTGQTMTAAPQLQFAVKLTLGELAHEHSAAHR